MGISKSTWNHSRDKYLNNFRLYYEYEVQYEGRSTNYHIIKKLDDYKKPPNKRSREQRDQVYTEKIVDVIKKDNLQTAKNVSRIIKDEDEIKAFHNKDSTVYEYTRLRMAEMFGRGLHANGTHGQITEKIWCQLDRNNNRYIPLSDEMIKAFCDLFAAEKDTSTEAELDLINDFHIGLITKEELAERIGEIGITDYISARKKFNEKYGFWPFKVPVYGLDEIHIKRFDKEDNNGL